MSASHLRKPWPMKWVLIAIVAMIVPYTFLTLRYRKAQPAFRPYEDMKNRANVTRLLAAGYQRIPITAQRPADGLRASGGASIAAAAGGLPSDLQSTLVETPALPADVLDVTAAPVAHSSAPYAIQLTCSLPSEKQQLSGGELYVRGETIVITPTFETVPGDLQTRTRTPTVLLTIPAASLKPGRYTVTVVGERASRTWPLDVR